MSKPIAIGGYFHDLKLINPDGSIAWECDYIKNGVVNSGLNYIGNVAFSSGAQITNWYVGLISAVAAAGLQPTDTMASNNFTEFQGYSGTRPSWINSTSGQQTSSTGSFSYTITLNGNIVGIFLTSSSTIGGTTGTLFSTALTTMTISAFIGQVLTGQYTILYAGG